MRPTLGSPRVAPAWRTAPALSRGRREELGIQGMWLKAMWLKARMWLKAARPLAFDRGG